jgi:hypothetical protein
MLLKIIFKKSLQQILPHLEDGIQGLLHPVDDNWILSCTVSVSSAALNPG